MPSWFDNLEMPITAVSSVLYLFIFPFIESYLKSNNDDDLTIMICPASLQESPKDEAGVKKAVELVHGIIKKEISAGTDPENIFVCGFSQGGSNILNSFFSIWGQMTE